jgi:hypothetical protein
MPIKVLDLFIHEEVTGPTHVGVGGESRLAGRRDGVVKQRRELSIKLLAKAAVEMATGMIAKQVPAVMVEEMPFVSIRTTVT